MSNPKQITVIQNDLIVNKKQQIYHGIGSVSHGSEIRISYQEEDQTKVSLLYDGSVLILKREGEVKSRLIFDRHNITSATVESGEGVLRFDVRTLDMIIEIDQIILFYEIYDSKELVSRYEIRWEWLDE